VLKKISDEIKATYYTQNYVNDGQRFVAWYVSNIHQRDLNQTKDDVTDGPDDKQIDAVVIDDDRSMLYIIQGKFYSGGSIDAEPLREVLSAWSQLKDVLKLQEHANKKLARKLSEIANALEDDYEVCFELITTGQLTASARADLARFQDEIANTEDFNASLHLIDNDELKRRYDLALERDNPLIHSELRLQQGKYMAMDVGGTRAIVAAVPLKDCITLQGIGDGTLFQKNVRQYLSMNSVNKGMKQTIYGDNHKDFFFFHNGITAICNSFDLQPDGGLKLKGLSVVNGCQSLNTILSCSEKVKTLDDSFVLFRFYEIPQRDRADRISIFTNSQSSVKPRDLRSNDKHVLALKRAFEQRYPQGTLLTKRGEQPLASKDKSFVVDLSNLGKYLISWHSQRPNIAYGENRIFDKYFEQIFRRNYDPENIQALNQWMSVVLKGWVPSNPHTFNESLLAMKAYAPYHHLYGVSACFFVINGQTEKAPQAKVTWAKSEKAGLTQNLVDIAASCLNTALESAANEPQPQNRVFSPHNWIKSKSCLSAINAAIRQYFAMLPAMPGGKELSVRLRDNLKLNESDFESRWAAD
jgi:hypothetical protein